MTRARYAPATRWLLLALLISGVAGMHTMGHPHEAHATVSGMYAEAHVDASHTAPHPTPRLGGPGQDDGDMAMCLAILTAGFLLLLQGFALVSWTRHTPLRWRQKIHRQRTRGPLRLVPPCLAIAAMTVLRI